MCMRCAILVLCGVLLLTGGHSLWAEEASTQRLGVRKQHVERSQAIALSAVFPGLGQLATGHRNRGTALVAAEVVCLVVWLTSHEDYNTQVTQFDLESERYFALREGGSFEQAEESWKRLSDKKDDLDGSHLRRRVFGVLAVAVYGYNLLDVLIFDGAEPVAEKPLSIVPMTQPRTAGVALVAWF